MSELPLGSRIGKDITSGSIDTASVPYRKLTAPLLDSGLFLAVFGALAYAVGYYIELREAIELGLPRSMLPLSSTEVIVFLGASLIIIATAVLLGLFALCQFCLVCISKRLKNKDSFDFRPHLYARARENPKFYSALGVVLLLVYLFGFSLFISVNTSKWPKITTLKTKSKTDLDGRDLRLFTRRDELLFMYDRGSKEFILIREDDIEIMVLSVGEITD